MTDHYCSSLGIKENLLLIAAGLIEKEKCKINKNLYLLLCLRGQKGSNSSLKAVIVLQYHKEHSIVLFRYQGKSIFNSNRLRLNQNLFCQ